MNMSCPGRRVRRYFNILDMYGENITDLSAAYIDDI